MKNKENNKHIPVMLDEIKSFIPFDKKINVIDATFGGGGYSRSILKSHKVNKLIVIGSIYKRTDEQINTVKNRFKISLNIVNR